MLVYHRLTRQRKYNSLLKKLKRSKGKDFVLPFFKVVDKLMVNKNQKDAKENLKAFDDACEKICKIQRNNMRDSSLFCGIEAWEKGYSLYRITYKLTDLKHGAFICRDRLKWEHT